MYQNISATLYYCLSYSLLVLPKFSYFLYQLPLNVSLYYYLFCYLPLYISDTPYQCINYSFLLEEAVARRCSANKVPLKILQNSQEDTCARVSFLINVQAPACNFIKKEALAQVFSCEFSEICKNNFFTEHLWTTASAWCFKTSRWLIFYKAGVLG